MYTRICIALDTRKCILETPNKMLMATLSDIQIEVGFEDRTRSTYMTEVNSICKIFAGDKPSQNIESQINFTV